MATARDARTLDEAARRGSTPDGGIPTAAALLAAARGRSDDDLENTTTSSASSPPCFRDATTTLGVAPANVNGGEHDGGDADLALNVHHILLTMVRNGAESGHLGLLALEPLDDSHRLRAQRVQPPLEALRESRSDERCAECIFGDLPAVRFYLFL